MFIVFFRTVILYFLVVLVMRLMGKRQIGELQPYEFTIALLIADLAAVPMGNIGIPLLYGIIPIATLLLAQMTISYFTMKSSKARELICGKPSIMIHRGKVCEKTMKSQRYNLNDLLEQLRSAGYFSIGDIEYAILETGGMLTVIPKALKRPVTPSDLNLAPSQDDLPVSVILDGKLDRENIDGLNLNMEAISQVILNAGFNSTSDILIAALSNGKELFIQGKEPNAQIIRTTLE